MRLFTTRLTWSSISIQLEAKLYIETCLHCGSECDGEFCDYECREAYHTAVTECLPAVHEVEDWDAGGL
jgi:hypothetical protein